MQKKIIALAIAGLASLAAFAQTNVTVYGKIDMSYEHSSGTGGSACCVRGAGSRLSGSPSHQPP